MKELSTEFKLVNDWMIDVEKYLFWLYGKNSENKNVPFVNTLTNGAEGSWRSSRDNASLVFSLFINSSWFNNITIGDLNVFEYHGLSPNDLYNLKLNNTGCLYEVEKELTKRFMHEQEYVDIIGDVIFQRWNGIIVKRCGSCKSRSINLIKSGEVYICNSCDMQIESENKKQAGYVYMFGSREFELYKIGCSVTPIKRKKLWDSSMPFELEMIHMFFTDDKYKEEKRIHDMFSEFSLQREWFKLSNDQVAQFEAIA